MTNRTDKYFRWLTVGVDETELRQSERFDVGCSSGLGRRCSIVGNFFGRSRGSRSFLGLFFQLLDRLVGVCLCEPVRNQLKGGGG